MNKMFFSKKQLDAIDMGIEVYKQYLYEHENMNKIYDKYAHFSHTMVNGHELSYNEKNKMLHNMIMDEAYSISGLDKERFPLKRAFNFQHFSTAFFSVVEEIVNMVNAKTEIQQAMLFAEVRSLADGDSLTFHIPSKHLLAISTVANGVRNSHIQKLWQEEVTLSPVAKSATVGLDLYKISTGTVDWGYLINQVTKSFRTKLQQEVVDTMYGSFSTLATQFKENTFVQDTYIQLAERVGAANGGTSAVAFGTKTALNTVLPTNDYLKMQSGAEFVNNGYLTAPFGIPTVKLEQSVKPNSAYDFSISNDYIILMSAGIDKPVKIALEGVTIIRQTGQFDTADMQSIFTIEQKWDVQIATMAHFGIVKVR